MPAYPKPILAEAQNYLTQEQSTQGPDKAAISQFQIAMFKLIIVKQSLQTMQDIFTSSRNWVSQEFFGGAQITLAVLGELSSLRHFRGDSTPTVDGCCYHCICRQNVIYEVPEHPAFDVTVIVIFKSDFYGILF